MLLLVLHRSVLYFQDYIRTLCNPEEIVPMTYPPELHNILTKPKIHVKLEKQSKTVILFPHIGDVHIQGLDTLSVTLAMSALEDIIAKYQGEGQDEDNPSKLSSHSARLGSSRLESELRRLSSQDENIIYDEDYSSMSDPVKRTILGWFMDESHHEESVPEVTDSQQSQPQIDAVLHKMAQLDVQTGDMPKKAAADAQIPPVAPQTPDKPYISQSEVYLRDFALSKGYADIDIQKVFQFYGNNLKASEFLNALCAVTQKSKPTQKSDGKKHKKSHTKTKRSKSAGAKNKTDNNYSDKPEHPLKKMIQTHSPNVKHNKMDQVGATADTAAATGKTVDSTGQFVDYWERLSKDFSEDEGTDIEALKQKSAERLRLLRDAFDIEPEGEAVLSSDSREQPQLKEREPLTWQQQEMQKKASQTDNGYHNLRRPGNQYGNQSNHYSNAQRGGSNHGNGRKQQAQVDNLDDFSGPFNTPNKNVSIPVSTPSKSLYIGAGQGHQNYNHYNNQPINGGGMMTHSQSHSARDQNSPSKVGRFSPTRAVPKTSSSTYSNQNASFQKEGNQRVMAPQTIARQSKLRYIIIDGSNIAMT